MKGMLPFAAASAAAALHAILIAAAILGLESKPEKSVSIKPVEVSLLQEHPAAPLASTEPLAPTVASPPPSPRKNLPKPRAHISNKQAPPAQIETPDAPPAATPSESNAAAPVAPAFAPPQPVKTGVSISASYAASNRKPPYPRLSRQNEEQGVVELRIFVKADGTAGTVEVASSSGYPLLDESARSTVQTWRFNPATVDGKPVGEWYRIPIPFKLQD